MPGTVWKHAWLNSSIMGSERAGRNHIFGARDSNSYGAERGGGAGKNKRTLIKDYSLASSSRRTWGEPGVRQNTAKAIPIHQCNIIIRLRNTADTALIGYPKVASD